jgi:hypothetical protein
MNTSSRRTLNIEVLSGATTPRCPRCGLEGLLSARVPHGWERGDRRRVNGTTIVVLCPTCDAENPEAGALITFFAVHGRITEDTLAEGANLLQQWAATIRLPTLDVAVLDAEVDAWRRGDLE